MGLRELLEIEDFPYDFSDLQLSVEEANKLLKQGYDSSQFTTCSRLAVFWGVKKTAISYRVKKSKLPRVTIGKNKFLPLLRCLRECQPKSVTEEHKLVLYRTLGQIDISVDGQIAELLKVKQHVLAEEETKELVLARQRVAEELVTQSLKLGNTRTQKDYLLSLAEEVTIEDWKLIIRKTVQLAIEGDTSARAWLSDYLIGKPIQRIAATIEDTTETFNAAERKAAIMSLLVGKGQIIEGEIISSGDDG